MKVLSMDGGGVKGLFYLYALTHLQEESNGCLSSSFDLVVGCSIGAVVGALLVTGQLDDKKTYNDMDDMVDRLLPHFFDRRQPGSPFLRPYYDGITKSKFLQSIFGDRTLGSLGHTKLAVITSCFGSLEERVFTSWGDPDVRIADVVDASSALPLFFPPVRVQQKFYWDGILVKSKTITSTLRIMTRYWQLTRDNKDGTYQKEELRDVLNSDRVHLCSMGNTSSVRSYYQINSGEEHVRSEVGLLALFRLGTIQSFMTSSDQEVEDELLHHLLPNGRYIRVQSRLDTKMVDVIEPWLRTACRQQADKIRNDLVRWLTSCSQ